MCATDRRPKRLEVVWQLNLVLLSACACCLPPYVFYLPCLALPWLGGWLGLLQVKAQQEKMGRTPGLDPDDDDPSDDEEEEEIF